MVVLYVLGTGPVIMMEDRKMIPGGGVVEKALEILYYPIEWLAEETPLEKPFGLYWHFWAPTLYDLKGNLIPQP